LDRRGELTRVVIVRGPRSRLSLSRMLIVALATLPTVAFDALLFRTVNVSVDSLAKSSVMGTLKLLLDSPAANASVPDVIL